MHLSLEKLQAKLFQLYQLQKRNISTELSAISFARIMDRTAHIST